MQSHFLYDFLEASLQLANCCKILTMFEQFQKHLIGKVEKALTEIVVEFAD